MAEDIRIGNLRWPLTLAARPQTTSFDDPGIAETFASLTPVHADVQPLGTVAWLNGKQIDINGITHRITIRWRGDIDMFAYLLRDRTRPDGTARREVFRIHRWSEWSGRQRFLLLDCELQEAPNV